MIEKKSPEDNVGESFNLWADSFHEGEWACRAIAEELVSIGGTFSANYLQGFIPQFDFCLNAIEFRVTVFGNYDSWVPLPKSLSALLAWGKPDLTLMQESTGQILLAVEETAATPTGNQGLQRCERQFGAAREGFPFWYLISEFGMHKDGGVRRDSIWPSLMGLELMAATQVPSIVLHYSDIENPEDYASGKGTKSLFKLILQVLLNSTMGQSPMHGLEFQIEGQIQEMVDFIEANWNLALYLVPDLSKIDVAVTAKKLCSITQTSIVGTTNTHSNFLKWPLTFELSSLQKSQQSSRDLIKNDPLAKLLEIDVDNGAAYGIIKGSGSKPQKGESLASWINAQNSKHENWRKTSALNNTEFSMHLDDFPRSQSGNHHVVTAPRILYLYDKVQQVQDVLWLAFERLRDKQLFEDVDVDLTALVYISNSVKPGRIFGDPYTGQLSAYGVSFGALSGSRKVVAYFPHQSISQAADYLLEPNNKGLRMMAELTDLLVFGGGVAIRTKTLEII